VVGVFVHEDPKSPDPLMKHGQIAFDWGKFFEKGLRTATGQCDVKRYNRQPRELIETDQAAPSFIVSHESPLDQAADAYKHFDSERLA
jgi:glutathione-independent formaldehyde dehydrogenase